MRYTVYNSEGHFVRSLEGINDARGNDVVDGFIVGIDMENPRNNVVLANELALTKYYIGLTSPKMRRIKTRWLGSEQYLSGDM